MALSVCGLESTDEQSIGTWTSEAIPVLTEQLGRIHYIVNETGTEANVSVQYATSSDGLAFSGFTMYAEDDLSSANHQIRINRYRLRRSNSCGHQRSNAIDTRSNLW